MDNDDITPMTTFTCIQHLIGISMAYNSLGYHGYTIIFTRRILFSTNVVMEPIGYLYNMCHILRVTYQTECYQTLLYLY